MRRYEKLLMRILRGTSDASIPFDTLCLLLHHLGFDERVRGGHHIFTQHRIVEILNIQPRGQLAKPYQVKQIREIILKYHLGDMDHG